MKRIKMFVAVLTAAMGLAMVPDVHTVTAEAAEPVTYSVKYVKNGDTYEWLSQANSSAYDDSVSGRVMYYLLNDLKDGDMVVVYNNVENAPLLDLGDIHLGSLTIADDQFTMVKVGSADNFYANQGSSSSITGTITNAFVYYNALCNFNSDVKILNVYYERDEENNAPNIGCSQKVEQVNFRSLSEPDWIYYSLYNFAADTLSIRNGILQTAETNYSREPIAPSTNTTSTNTTSTNTTSTNTPAAGSSSSSNSEYDDVPRTGQNNIYLWLLAAAAACFVGSGLLKRASR